MTNEDDFEDEPKNSDYIEDMKLQIESEFFEHVETNSSISFYLYMPVDLLSDNVKTYLHNYLLDISFEYIQ